MAITKSTAESNAEWLESVQTFRDQLEIHKNNMEEIKEDFKQMESDIRALRERGEDCSKGIYTWEAWNLFSRSMIIKTLLDDEGAFERVRQIMIEGLGLPYRDYNGEFDNDFDEAIRKAFADISEPDPSKALDLPKRFNR